MTLVLSDGKQDGATPRHTAHPGGQTPRVAEPRVEAAGAAGVGAELNLSHRTTDSARERPQGQTPNSLCPHTLGVCASPPVVTLLRGLLCTQVYDPPRVSFLAKT